jgi:RNA recognition motif-containing protein
MSRVFVRNIPSKTKQFEVEDLFKKAGKIIDIVLKPNFAFIQYNHEYEANQAVATYNDYYLNGNRISVELAKSRIEKLAERISEKCFKCSEYGHWAKDCKLLKTEVKEDKRKFRRMRRSPRRSFSRSLSYESNDSVDNFKSKSRSRSRSNSKHKSRLQ